MEELNYLEVLYDPNGCCQGKGRTDGKECCGGEQCDTNYLDLDDSDNILYPI